MSDRGRRTYTDVGGGALSMFREWGALFARTRGGRAADVGELVEEMRWAEGRILGSLGIDLRGLTVVDLGCGQMYRQARYLAARNDVIGIDYEVIPRGFDVGAYVRLGRRNGLRRLMKTIGRKALGIDRQVGRAIAAEVGAATGKITLEAMDAASLSLADASVDFVFSVDTFEHLPDPAAAAREVSRVLRPGGGCFISTHLYSSDSGHHDLRVSKHHDFVGGDWAHLRPALAGAWSSNAYCNGLRLDAWRSLFAEALPGCVVELVADRRADLAARLAALRAAGELEGYRDEELLSVSVLTLWRKGGAGGG